jgi:hypothetical protein
MAAHHPVRRRVLAAVAVAAAAAAVAVPLVRIGGQSPTVEQPPAKVVHVSPSGLPVGLLSAGLELKSVNNLRAELWLVVRADGTGLFRVWNPEGLSGGPEAYPVQLVATGPGRVQVRPDDLCDGAPAVTLGFTRQAGSVKIVSAEAPDDCIIGPDTAAAMNGLTIRVQEAPPGSG